MHEKDFSLREGLFETKGVIGRGAYLRNILIIFAVSVFVTYLLGGYGTPDPASTMGLTGTIFFVFMTYLLLINSFRRMRDIRGTTDKQMLYQLGLIVLLFLPVVSILTLGYLLFAKGTVTTLGADSSIEIIPRENSETTHLDDKHQDHVY